MTTLDDLLTRTAIEAVLVADRRAVDRQDLQLLLSVYHADAIDERTDPLPAAVWAEPFLRDRHAKGTRSTHMLTNVSVVIEAGGEVAHTESYVLAVQHDPPAASNAEVDLLAYGGRYLDVFELRGHWAITHRRVVHDWDTLSTMRQLPWLQHLAQGLPVPHDLAGPHLAR